LSFHVENRVEIKTRHRRRYSEGEKEKYRKRNCMEKRKE
jgi:hypothetical protein